MKYVLCDHCRKKIKFGDHFYNDGIHCAVYCSPKCYINANTTVEVYILNDSEAEDNRCEVFIEEDNLLNKENKGEIN